MLKKTITYTDYNGKERTEDFYFNLTKAEIVEMELSESGGLAKHIEKLTKEEDGAKIIELFKTVIEKAYGVKTDDGRRFRKSKELFLDFAETPAYDLLFMELSQDAKLAAAFMNGIVPAVPNEMPKG
jgi:hypothetical protein